MQEEEFVFDFGLVKIGGCDIVLGTDLINIVAPIVLSARPLGISFIKEGQWIQLLGHSKANPLTLAWSKNITRMVYKG